MRLLNKMNNFSTSQILQHILYFEPASESRALDKHANFQLDMTGRSNREVTARVDCTCCHLPAPPLRRRWIVRRDTPMQPHVRIINEMRMRKIGNFAHRCTETETPNIPRPAPNRRTHISFPVAPPLKPGASIIQSVTSVTFRPSRLSVCHPGGAVDRRASMRVPRRPQPTGRTARYGAHLQCMSDLCHQHRASQRRSDSGALREWQLARLRFHKQVLVVASGDQARNYRLSIHDGRWRWEFGETEIEDAFAGTRNLFVARRPTVRQQWRHLASGSSSTRGAAQRYAAKTSPR